MNIYLYLFLINKEFMKKPDNDSDIDSEEDDVNNGKKSSIITKSNRANNYNDSDSD